MAHIWETEEKKRGIAPERTWIRPCSYYAPGKRQPEGGRGTGQGGEAAPSHPEMP